jgi:deoxyribonuclease IV
MSPRRSRDKAGAAPPLLGAHMSVASGLHRALDRLREAGGQALQIFLKNQRQWAAPPMSPPAIDQFIASWRDQNRPPVAAHGSYLINLASLNEDLIEKSIVAFADELQRAALLRIPYLVVHPGAHLGAGIEAGLESFVKHMDVAIARAGVPEVSILIENTAGQGTQLGAGFEEAEFILAHSRFRDLLGLCFDTAHAFAAGYDIRTPQAYRRTVDDLDSHVGIRRVKFFHLNDSRKDLGSRVDRHEHIGQGKIGLEGFRQILNDSRWAGLPMVLETPKDNDLENDKANLRVLRGLLR